MSKTPNNGGVFYSAEKSRGLYNADQIRSHHHIDAKFDQISSNLNGIVNSISTLGEHVAILEQRVGANEDNLTDTWKKIIQLEKANAYLVDKVDDLENRSRSCNLRFIKVPEASEGRDMLGFMSSFIQQLLGHDNFPTQPAIERAHRTPTVRQDERSNPRPILIKLAHFQDKVKILRLAREKKELLFNGSRVLIFPDYSAELARRRRAFDPVKRRLRERSLKFALRYPCTLSVWVDGKEHQFRDSTAAETVFMTSRDSSTTSP